jgi:hypothetical protein
VRGPRAFTVSMAPVVHLELLRLAGSNRKVLARHVRETAVRLRTEYPDRANLSADVREAVREQLGAIHPTRC